ncbi:MAG: glutamate-5-semialdehyde dehydrogenase [Erysipelotrichaceae bacterium]|nr:glutamate-5-semialdehyde dehydrogenase [Erysipelotrichaceae bacterium]
MNSLNQIAIAAKKASKQIASLVTNHKDKVLQDISEALILNTDMIMINNMIDIENARSNNMNPSLIDRLMLNPERIKDIALGIMQIIKLPDPINVVLDEWVSQDGLEIQKVCVPIGVIGMIYEARPNVSVDAATLAFKAGNAIILRGGSSAYYSNLILVKIMQEVLIKNNLNPAIISYVEDTSHTTIDQMLKMRDHIDLIIPRGGANLIKKVVNDSTVPILETGIGNCHIFIDESADYEMAQTITINSKTQRTGVCNAIETLLIHKNWSIQNTKKLIDDLLAHNVELHADQNICKFSDKIILSTDHDWQTEYLDMILAVRYIDDIDKAIEHIDQYGTKHTECIITSSQKNAIYFQKNVDAAVVNVNASTRFTDGFMFGFGAELGISTQKLHARGPMGLKEITCYKYLVTGSGQIRK